MTGDCLKSAQTPLLPVNVDTVELVTALGITPLILAPHVHGLTIRNVSAHTKDWSCGGWPMMTADSAATFTVIVTIGRVL